MIRSSLREIVLRDQEIASSFDRLLKNSTRQLDSIRTSVTALSPLIEKFRADTGGLRSARNVAPGTSASPRSPKARAKVLTSSFSPAPQNNILEAPCTGLCMCRCHKTLKFSSPRWAESLVGMVLMSWSSVLKRPLCSERRCQRSNTNMLRLQYYFPSWFIRRVIYLQHQFVSTEGHVIYIKTPRIVPANSDIFVMTRTSNIGKLQVLFGKGLASPFDVNPEGFSSLQVGSLTKNPDLVKMPD